MNNNESTKPVPDAEQLFYYMMDQEHYKRLVSEAMERILSQKRLPEGHARVQAEKEVILNDSVLKKIFETAFGPLS